MVKRDPVVNAMHAIHRAEMAGKGDEYAAKLHLKARANTLKSEIAERKRELDAILARLGVREASPWTAKRKADIKRRYVAKLGQRVAMHLEQCKIHAGLDQPALAESHRAAAQQNLYAMTHHRKLLDELDRLAALEEAITNGN